MTPGTFDARWDAEERIASAVITYGTPAVAELARRAIDPSLFADGVARRIVAAALGQHDAGGTVDTSTILAMLGDRDRADAAGMIDTNGRADYVPAMRREVADYLAVLTVEADATPRRIRATSLAGRRRVRVDTILPTIAMPRGAISVMCGWQGIGKGTLSAYIIAALTRAGHGAAVVSDEDSLDATILPRLQAAGADLDHVHTYEPIDPDDTGGVLLPRDLAEIRADVPRYGLRLLLLDPWTNHMDVQSLDRGDVRRPLMALARMCHDTLLAALLNAHPNRRGEFDDPLATIAHAGAVSQVARAVFFLTFDPDHGAANAKENPYRLLIHGKANMTRHHDTRRFEIMPTLLPAEDGQPEVDTVRAVDRGTSPIADFITARDRLRHIARINAPDDDTTATGRCAAWLREYLADGAPHPRDDVLRAANDAGGWSTRTVQRARARVGVDTVRPFGVGATTPGAWALRQPPEGEKHGATGATRSGSGEEDGSASGATGATLPGSRAHGGTAVRASEGVAPVAPVAPHSKSVGATPADDPDDGPRSAPGTAAPGPPDAADPDAFTGTDPDPPPTTEDTP